MAVKVSTGLAVYNGERYIAQAIESLLGQTYCDFELIISDNCSTDRTEAICLEYSRKDKRIKYFRQKENMGAAWNFNFVAKQANGKYFKWMAHDDLCHEQFFKAAVDVLEQNPQIILCYSRCMDIDESGRNIREKEYSIRGSSDETEKRFCDLVNINHNCVSVFGLIRKRVLDRTRLIDSYVGSDRVLLAKLGLEGAFYRIGEVLLYHREHPARSTRSIPSLQDRIGWFDPSKAATLTYPHWRLWCEYMKAVASCRQDNKTKIQCYKHLVRWILPNRRNLVNDIKYAISFYTGRLIKNDVAPQTT